MKLKRWPEFRVKWHFQIIALFLLVNIGFSQKKANVACGYFGKKTVAERNKTFPFSEAKKIILVGFPSPRGIYEDKNGNQIPVDSLDFSKSKIKEVVALPSGIQKYIVTEKVELNESQINELSNLLLNYTLNRKPKTVFAVNCYEPRNAILFLDENDKIISYIEVCFECNQFYQMPKETITDFNILCKVEECSHMIGFFKDFFKKAGIKQGVEQDKMQLGN